MLNIQEQIEIYGDQRLAEHFIKGELVADPNQIEAEPQALAINGLKQSVNRFISARKVAVATVGLGLLTAGLVTGAHRTAHS